MQKSDKGGWKVADAAPNEAILDEAPAEPEVNPPRRRRIWPFGKHPEAPVA